MPIPQYITTDQAKSLLTAAQQQGISPAAALKSLTDNGHIIQGVNDSQYNNQQISQQTPQGKALAGEDTASPTPSTSFLDQGSDTGAIGLITAPLRGASKGLLNFGAGAAKLAGKLFGSQKLQDAATNFQQKNLQNTDTGLEGALQTGGNVIGSAIPYVAAGALTGGLADAAGAAGAGGAEAMGLGEGAQTAASVVGKGAVGALTQGATALVGSGGDKKSAEIAAVAGGIAPALSQYVLSPAIDGISSKFAGGAASDAAASDAANEAGATGAVNASSQAFKDAAIFQKSIGTELAQGAQTLADDNPDAVFKLSLGNANLAQQIADVPGVNAEMLTGDISPSDVQNISSTINKAAASTSNDVQRAALYNLNSDFRSYAQEALNNASAGTGDQLENLYSTAAGKYNALETVNDVFKPNANPTAKEITALNKYVRTQAATPEGRIALQQTIQQFQEATGIDLSSSVKQMSFTPAEPTAPKESLISKLSPTLLKLLGLTEIGHVANTVIGHFNQ